MKPVYGLSIGRFGDFLNENSEGARVRLIQHLKQHSLRTDGPFTLRSGAVSPWYLDARQTTFDGSGARLVGKAVLSVLDPGCDGVGGLTMGADPIAVATAIEAASDGRTLYSFSVRKEAKDHGTGGRLVGPVAAGSVVAVLEDTTTTGGAILEAVDALQVEGVRVAQAIVLVDRSDGRVDQLLKDLDIPYRALVIPEDLGVGP